MPVTVQLPNKNKDRAGQYIRQTSGYRAFIPKPLPPAPRIKIDAQMQQLLSASDRALGCLDGSIQTLPNPDLFVFMYVRKEAVLSSQIEGTQASLNDVIRAEANIFDAGRPSDVSEVLNYVEAMNHGLLRLKELPLSVRLIREIHERLLQGVRGHYMQPGELRASQNWIGPSGCLLTDAVFVPPPHTEVPNALGDLERFWHADDNIPPLIKIGLAHAQFETIHPFLDGNGRIGRLLITFFLCQQNILQKPVLYLSYYLKENRQEYYHNLQRVRDRGDWESWLKFFLKGVAEVSQQATVLARDIVALRERHRNEIALKFGQSGGRAMRLLERMFEHPTVTVKQVSDFLGITFPSANSLVLRFLEQGVLEEMTGNSRNRVFMYMPYIELFSNMGRSESEEG